jgi:hypothetical protein
MFTVVKGVGGPVVEHSVGSSPVEVTMPEIYGGFPPRHMPAR